MAELQRGLRALVHDSVCESFLLLRRVLTLTCICAQRLSRRHRLEGHGGFYVSFVRVLQQDKLQSGKNLQLLRDQLRVYIA